MVFEGISRVFSLENEEQYKTIGAFWDELSEKYRLENLQGLGYNWTEHTMEYVIGLKEGMIEESNCKVALPDEGWTTVSGKTEDLSKIYRDIYMEGNLIYEIETFTDDGDCTIRYYR